MSPRRTSTLRMRLQPLARRGDHAFAGVEAQNRLRVRREQFGQHAVAGRDVEHVAASIKPVRRARQRLPGAAGRIMALHVAGDGVGPAFGAGALREDRRQAARIVVEQAIVDVRAQRECSSAVGLARARV